MNELGTGTTTLLLMLAISLFMHEPWRWLGLAVGSRIDIQSPWFQWVRGVASALVAGLVVRLILFPAGALAAVSSGVRLCAMAAGIAVFFSAGRNLGAGVGTGALVLVAGRLLFG